MRASFIWLFVALTAVGVSSNSLSAAETPRPGQPSLTDAQMEVLFAEWMKTYSKSYRAEDVPLRFKTWKQNLDIVRSHNAGNHSFQLGMNSIADLTLDEFRRFKLGFRPNLTAPTDEEVPLSTSHTVQIPKEVDWRMKKAVSAVRDQGTCGSCYTWSSAGAIEGAMVIAGYNLTALSSQQLLDCSRKYGNGGCDGGLMTSTFTYIRANGGVCAFDAYPYTGKVGVCNAACKKVEGTALRSHTNIAKKEPALLSAIAQQPVSVAVAAGSSIWQLYRNGVMDSNKCGRNLDHAGVAVGYGTTDAGIGYIIFKNSWGPSWGEEGFIRLVRGKDMCGINDMPTVPNLALKNTNNL